MSATSLYPVYTVIEECRDCYKCVRHCPVKAIGVKDTHAYIMPYYCIACGLCVKACPKHAKHVRNDLDKVKNILKTKREVYISLSSSWAGLFSRYTKGQMIYALKQLGFAGVSETGLGVEEVSAAVADDFRNTKLKLQISSHCPVVVDYLCMYMGEYARYLTPYASPTVTHAKMLHEEYGDDIGVVFIGPCMGKKNESDRNPELLDAVLTFEKVFDWFREEKINVDAIPKDVAEDFVPRPANEGSLYAIPEGINKGLQVSGVPNDVKLLSISGINQIQTALKGLNIETLKNPVFLEAFACTGGCINGPCRGIKKSNISVISSIIEHSPLRERENRVPKIKVSMEYKARTQETFTYTREQMTAAMEKIGRMTLADELNCGGCGYDSCRHLAQAIIRGDAEPSMCVAYTRINAEKKANAMLHSMPDGVVIVDKDLQIIELNEAFHSMFGKELCDTFAGNLDAMIGFNIERFIPYGDVFQSVMRVGKNIRKEHSLIEKDLYDITVFPIEVNKYAGAIITNVTETEMRRDEIRKRAQEVISKNISTVQEIAYLLGEHMVETELLLNSIAEGDNAEDDKK